MKERWMKNDEGWTKNDEGWIRMMKDEWRMMKHEWRMMEHKLRMMKDEWWMKNDEGWWVQAVEGFCRQTDRMTDRRTDIGNCRVAFVTENIFTCRINYHAEWFVTTLKTEDQFLRVSKVLVIRLYTIRLSSKTWLWDLYPCHAINQFQVRDSE